MEKESRQWLQALSYVIWPVGIVVLLFVPDRDKMLRFHAAQGFIFSLGSFLAWWILSMFFVFMWYGALLNIVVILWIVLAVWYATRAYKSEAFKVPIAIDLAKKIQPK